MVFSITNQLLYQLSYAGEKEPRRLPYKAAVNQLLVLLADARIRGERFRRLQILDDGAEIQRFGIKGLVLCDLGAIQNLESITLEHFFAAPAFERDDLSVNTFLTRAVKITQICAHQSARRGNLARIREKIDVKMRNAPRRCGHLAPAMHERPANETTRTFVIAQITGQRAEKEPNVLVKRVKLIAQWLARAKQVASNFAIDFKEKTRFRFVVGIVSGKKISEQLSIFVNGIDRFAEESGLAAQFSYRFTIGSAKTADCK